MTWTDEQAAAWVALREWTFARYYKYRFTFTATEGSVTAAAYAGGDSGDIYRWDVEPVMTWKGIRYAATDLRIIDADGAVLYEQEDVRF